jgi:adenosyl cobinamide kinase/adenosyl cobinamide phosphate guanylyltransferase
VRRKLNLVLFQCLTLFLEVQTTLGERKEKKTKGKRKKDFIKTRGMSTHSMQQPFKWKNKRKIFKNQEIGIGIMKLSNFCNFCRFLKDEIITSL